MITKAVLDKDEYFLWSVLQWNQSCHSNEMTSLPILLAQDLLTCSLFLGTSFRNCRSFNIWNSWTNLMTSSQLLRWSSYIYFFILQFQYMKLIWFIFPGCIINQFNDRLPAVLPSQSVEPCTGIAKVRVEILASMAVFDCDASSLHWYVTTTTTNTSSRA